MIGQSVMFATTEGKLRNRVELSLCGVADVRQALERWHYLHRARTGRQVNYLILQDGTVEGVITFAYPMMSAPLCGVPSDEVLEFARLYLHHNTPHVASCAIGKSIRRIVRDFATLYPEAKPPRLLVSWSDTTRHVGTVYRASNFTWLRRTKGQPHGNKAGSKRGVREQHGDYSNDKDCWVYPLDKSVEVPA